MPRKIKSIYPSCSQLQQIVVQALLAHSDHGCRILERVSHQLNSVFRIRIWHSDAIVQFAPYTDFFYYFFHCTLFSSYYLATLSTALGLSLILMITGFAHAAHSWLHEPFLFEFLYFPILKLSIPLPLFIRVFLLNWFDLLDLSDWLGLLRFLRRNRLNQRKVHALAHERGLILWLIAFKFSGLFATTLIFFKSFELVYFTTEV